MSPPVQDLPTRLKGTAPLGRHRVHAVVWTLGLIAAAAGTRWLLDPWLHERIPFATFFIGVVVAVRYAGVRSALGVMLGGVLVAAPQRPRVPAGPGRAGA